MFQLTKLEFNDLKSQFATSSSTWGGRRSPPYAFSEYGVLQIANLINSDLANSVSVFVIRAFVEMRETIVTQQKVLNEKNAIIKSNRKLLPIPETRESKNIEKFLNGIGPKLQKAMDYVLDTVIDSQSGTTIRDEAHDILKESINNLKEQLKQKGLQNEEIPARINKLLAEAEKERATARKSRAESEQLEFVNLVRKLRLVLEAQKIMLFVDDDHEEIKRINTFIITLREILKD